ncbi:alpha/beta hydrolase [Pseudonocardia nematodicida]|uniref:Alpha/beta hydrolase n=1 Tax=Pseudonocardia nematodicida TaxID=1206997 RepID=A0ABV1K7H0_9PSEU
MAEVSYRHHAVAGRRVFVRESGPPDGPVVLLLHGFPTSSRMYRALIPALGERYRVIAPDHIGFGHSDAPAADEFDYTFDALTDVTEALLDELGVERFAVVVQDYGAPIAWRLALRRPSAITAVISQNGNAYDDGFVEEFWAPVWAYSRAPGPDTEPAVRGALGEPAIRWQYLHGVDRPELVDPDTWTIDAASMARHGSEAAQLSLFRDYATNVPLYPRLHAWFRETQVPLLAVWGENDEIFGPAGARAFARDLPDAEIHLVPGGGHFLIESHPGTVLGHLEGFLERRLGTGADRGGDDVAGARAPAGVVT